MIRQTDDRSLCVGSPGARDLTHPEQVQRAITTTEFYGSVKSGQMPAKTQEAETVSFTHPPELLAETILGLIGLMPEV